MIMQNDSDTLASIFGGMKWDTACTQQTATQVASYPQIVYRHSTYEWGTQTAPQQQSFSEAPQQKPHLPDGAILQHNAGDKSNHRFH